MVDKRKKVESLMNYKWRYCVDKAMLAHNSKELQDKLEVLGYRPLRWTVCDEKIQKLIIDPFPGSYGREPYVIHYEGCFWNGGVTPIENRDEIGVRGNCFYCGDDEELFFKWAEKLMIEKEVYFDKDKNEVKID